MFEKNGNEVKLFLIWIAKDEPTETEYVNPCVPSPCGLNARCETVGNAYSCTCLPNYFGQPPNCRPECTIDADCRGDRACFNNKCRDPCPGTCGLNALCNTINHAPICTCMETYTGDPYRSCYPNPPLSKYVSTHIENFY